MIYTLSHCDFTANLTLTISNILDIDQVDAHLLKVVAIENAKDPYGAIGFILSDVIPHTVKEADASSAVDGSLGSSVECRARRQCSSACASSSELESTAASKAAIEPEIMKPSLYVDPPCLNEKIQDPLGSTSYSVKVLKDFYDILSGYDGSEVQTTSQTLEGTQ